MTQKSGGNLDEIGQQGRPARERFTNPDWDVVFDIFFTHGRDEENGRRYLDHIEPATTHKTVPNQVRRYFTYVEAAFRIGWEPGLNPAKAMEEIQRRAESEQYQNMRYVDGMTRTQYAQCWSALIKWCRESELWLKARDSICPQLEELAAAQGDGGNAHLDSTTRHQSARPNRRTIWTPRYLALGAGSLIATMLLVGVLGVHSLMQPEKIHGRLFSSFGTVIPQADDPVLSLDAEVKKTDGPSTSYSHTATAAVGDTLTIAIYLFNPRWGTRYLGGSLTDQLPAGGGSIRLRATVTFLNPELSRDSTATLVIPASTHLEYVRNSVRLVHEGAAETGYPDGPYGNPMFLPQGLDVGTLLGGSEDTSDPSRLWYTYSIRVVQDSPNMPAWNTGVTSAERDWFLVQDLKTGKLMSSSPPIVHAGDDVAFEIFLYNDTCGLTNYVDCTMTPASDTLVAISLPSRGGRVTAVIAAENSGFVYRDLQVTLPPDTSIGYELGSTQVEQCEQPGNPFVQCKGAWFQAKDGVVDSGLHLGDIAGDYTNGRWVYFRTHVRYNPRHPGQQTGSNSFLTRAPSGIAADILGIAGTFVAALLAALVLARRRAAPVRVTHSQRTEAPASSSADKVTDREWESILRELMGIAEERLGKRSRKVKTVLESAEHSYAGIESAIGSLDRISILFVDSSQLIVLAGELRTRLRELYVATTDNDAL